MSKSLFRPPSKDDVKIVYVCPRCGSKNWKIANPIEPTDSVINLPQLVNQILECTDCGFIGTFFQAKKSEIISTKIKKTSAMKPEPTVMELLRLRSNKESNSIKRGFFRGVSLFVLAFISVVIIIALGGTLLAVGLGSGLIIFFRKSLLKELKR